MGDLTIRVAGQPDTVIVENRSAARDAILRRVRENYEQPRNYAQQVVTVNGQALVQSPVNQPLESGKFYLVSDGRKIEPVVIDGVFMAFDDHVYYAFRGLTIIP